MVGGYSLGPTVVIFSLFLKKEAVQVFNTTARVMPIANMFCKIQALIMLPAYRKLTILFDKADAVTA